MSALLQQYPSKENEVSDDLESFVHVLTWNSVRYYLPNYSRKNTEAISTLLRMYFDLTGTEGVDKYEAMCLGRDIAENMLCHPEKEHPLNIMRQALVKHQ